MTPEQARAARLAYDHLGRYLSSDVVADVPTDEALAELTYGNLLAAETLVVILAKLRGKTFDQVLDDMPECDEGHPPGPAVTNMWEIAVYQLRYLHARSWERRPEPSRIHDRYSACRGSFNLVVAAVTELASETQRNAYQLIGVLKDAAAAQESR